MVDTWQEANNQVLELMEKEQWQEALEAAVRALAVARKEFGEVHPLVAVAFNNLGELYHILGSFTESEAAFRRSLAISEGESGDAGPEIADTLFNLAELMISKEETAEAGRCMERVVALYEGHDTDPLQLAGALHYAAMIAQHLGETEKAQNHLLAGLAAAEKKTGRQ